MDDKIKKAFGEVHAEDELKKKTADFLARKTLDYGNGRRRVFTSRRVAAALASLVFVLSVLSGTHLFFTPVAAVGVDADGSVELSVNRYGKVIAVKDYGDPAQTADVKYMEYTVALDTLMSSDTMERYLASDEPVSITVTGSNAEKNEEMLERISACKYARNENVVCRYADADEAKQAREYGMPFGKYQAFLELQKLDPGVTVDEVKSLTMRQIRDRIAALSGEEYTTHTDGSGQGRQNKNANSGQGRNGN